MHHNSVSLIYGEHLANVHFGDIPHTFIPHFTLHSAEKILVEYSTNYSLTTFCIPQTPSRLQAPILPNDVDRRKLHQIGINSNSFPWPVQPVYGEHPPPTRAQQ